MKILLILFIMAAVSTCRHTDSMMDDDLLGPDKEIPDALLIDEDVKKPTTKLLFIIPETLTS